MEGNKIDRRFDVQLQKSKLEDLIKDFKKENTIGYKKLTFLNFFFPFQGVLSFFENGFYSLKNKNVEKNLEDIKEIIIEDLNQSYGKSFSFNDDQIGLLESSNLVDYIKKWSEMRTIGSIYEKKKLLDGFLYSDKYKLVDTNFSGKIISSVMGLFFSTILLAGVSNNYRLETFLKYNENQKTTIHFSRINDDSNDALIDIGLGFPFGTIKYVLDLENNGKYKVEVENEFLFGYSENKKEKEYEYLKEKIIYKKPITFKEIKETRNKIFSKYEQK